MHEYTKDLLRGCGIAYFPEWLMYLSAGRLLGVVDAACCAVHLPYCSCSLVSSLSSLLTNKGLSCLVLVPCVSVRS